jgi:hypothetical protein
MLRCGNLRALNNKPFSSWVAFPSSANRYILWNYILRFCSRATTMGTFVAPNALHRELRLTSHFGGIAPVQGIALA